MEFKDELKRVIAEHEALNDPQIELELSGSGRVGGYIVSGSFGGRSQIERQEMLWDYLRKKLSDDDRARINLLLTLTPQEAREDLDDETAA